MAKYYFRGSMPTPGNAFKVGEILRKSKKSENPITGGAVQECGNNIEGWIDIRDDTVSSLVAKWFIDHIQAHPQLGGTKRHKKVTIDSFEVEDSSEAAIDRKNLEERIHTLERERNVAIDSANHHKVEYQTLCGVTESLKSDLAQARENVQERTPIKTATGALLRYFDSLEIQVSPYIQDTMDLDYIRRVKIGEIEDSEQTYIQERMQNVSEDNIEQLLQYDVDSKESELEKRGTEVKTLEKKIEYILGVKDDPDHPMYEEIVSLFAERVEDFQSVIDEYQAAQLYHIDNVDNAVEVQMLATKYKDLKQNWNELEQENDEQMPVIIEGLETGSRIIFPFSIEKVKPINNHLVGDIKSRFTGVSQGECEGYVTFEVEQDVKTVSSELDEPLYSLENCGYAGLHKLIV